MVEGKYIKAILSNGKEVVIDPKEKMKKLGNSFFATAIFRTPSIKNPRYILHLINTNHIVSFTYTDEIPITYEEIVARSKGLTEPMSL